MCRLYDETWLVWFAFVQSVLAINGILFLLPEEAAAFGVLVAISGICRFVLLVSKPTDRPINDLTVPSLALACRDMRCGACCADVWVCNWSFVAMFPANIAVIAASTYFGYIISARIYAGGIYDFDHVCQQQKLTRNISHTNCQKLEGFYYFTVATSLLQIPLAVRILILGNRIRGTQRLRRLLREREENRANATALEEASVSSGLGSILKNTKKATGNKSSISKLKSSGKKSAGTAEEKTELKNSSRPLTREQTQEIV